MNFNAIKYRPLNIFLLLFSFAFLCGVLSPSHFPPSQMDIYIGFYIVALTSVGLIGWYLNYRTNYITLSSGLFATLAILILLQPFLNTVEYVDSLIFPIATLLISALVANIATNLTNSEKEYAMKLIAITMVIAGVLLTLTQFLQIFWPSLPNSILFPISQTNPRVMGNIAQPNQAACVLALALVSINYLMYINFSERNVSIKSLKGISFFFVLFILATAMSMTASRSLLFLSIAALVGIAFYKWQSKRFMLKCILAVAFAMTLGYLTGIYILDNFIPKSNVISSINRLVNEDSLHTRVSLLKQAGLAFSENWLTGIGWGNFSEFGIQNSQKIDWLDNAKHSHNIIAQIAAELGVLGLIVFVGFLIVLFKNIPGFLKRTIPSYKTYTFILIVIIGLYSLSEYPLWYPKFLLPTAFFIGILDDYKFKITWSKDVNKVLIGFLSIVIAASSFYIIRYDDYLRVYVRVNTLPEYKDKIKEYSTLPSVYGFTNYREMIQFLILLNDEFMLDQRIELGYRVINNNSSAVLIEKQAVLLATAGRKDEADQLFITLCQMRHTKDCIEVKKFIIENGLDDKDGYVDRLEVWRSNR